MSKDNTVLREPYGVVLAVGDDAPVSELTVENAGLRALAHDAFNPDHYLNRPGDGKRPLQEMLVRAKITTPELAEAKLQRALEATRRLRHSNVLKSGDAARWISGVFCHEPGRLIWHIARLNGVPASTAYAYVAERQGQRSRFVTARELDMTRMMRLLPGAENAHTFRGTHLEKLAQHLFYESHSEKLEHDPEGLARVRKQRGAPGMPWLIGTPDDLAIYRREPNVGARFLNDYKVPADPDALDEEAPLEYVVQLHCYAMQAGAAEAKVSGILLTRLYVAEDLATLWARMIEDDPQNLDAVLPQARFAMQRNLDSVQLRVQQIKLDLDLAESIRQACGEADARVLRGEIAPWPAGRGLALSEEGLAEARQIEAQLSTTLALGEAMDQRSAAMKKRLAELYAGTDPKQASGLSLISVQRTRPLDASAAVDFLRGMGQVTDSLLTKTSGSEIQNDKVLKALKAADVDPSRFQGELIKIGLNSRTPNEGIKAQVADLRSRAALMAQQLVDWEPTAPVVEVVPETRSPSGRRRRRAEEQADPTLELFPCVG